MINQDKKEDRNEIPDYRTQDLYPGKKRKDPEGNKKTKEQKENEQKEKTID